MRNRYLHSWAGFAALVVAGLATPAAAEECLTDWGTAGQIVRREKLMTVQQLTQSEQVLLPGKPIKTTLCKVGDDYIYKVVVRTSGGGLQTIVVDARQPDVQPTAATKSR
ncbi:MAG TPA: hypothetical protein PLD46_08245 [Hyphomicrobium sp.]|nr:hypothetical protein [Hyphomicrobium sp.]